MPSFDIVKESSVEDTFRVEMVKSSFDVSTEHSKEHFIGEIPIEGMEWKIGLIVGPSGSGKSTIARELFGISPSPIPHSAKSVIDDMPKGVSFDEISKAFYSVGFASVPSWLKPYDVLSNGERTRVDLAYHLLSPEQTIVFDEYTSVLDRKVAQTASMAICKSIHNSSKRFIAVSCHYDIIEYLNPDWIYDTSTMTFSEYHPSEPKKKPSVSVDATGTNGNVLGNIIISTQTSQRA